MIAMENKWSVSAAENGAELAENWVSGNGAVSGGLQKTMEHERSAELRSGNGAESGVSRNALSVERLFLPLTLRSRHVLAEARHSETM